MRTCPVCEDPFDIDTTKRGRAPVYCSPECKAIGSTDPKDAVRRFCPICETAFTVDMTDRMGAAPTYCSDKCVEISKGMARFRKMYTCLLSGCDKLVPHPNYFCTKSHQRKWLDAHERRKECLQCGIIIPIAEDDLKRPAKFCSRECREELMEMRGFQASRNALRERDLDNRQRTTRFAKEGKRGKRSTKPHDYTMAMSHVEKLRWGLYPERLLIQILKLGWTDEAEFFTTEDRWPPAIYEKIKEVPVDARTPVGATIGVRDYGETEPRPLPPDTAAPSEAEYRKRARDIINAYEAETDTPDYVQNYILSTGHNPERR